MIGSGPGQHHREHCKDNQEGRGFSPNAFSSGLSSRMFINRFAANNSSGRQDWGWSLSFDPAAGPRPLLTLTFYHISPPPQPQHLFFKGKAVEDPPGNAITL